MADEPEVSVETFAAGLPEKFLHCRELGHTWRPFTVQFDSVARAYDRVLRCSRCYTRRIQTLTTSGHIVSSRYDYVNGYQAKNVAMPRGGVRDVYRLESIVRFLDSEVNLRRSDNGT